MYNFFRMLVYLIKSHIFLFKKKKKNHLNIKKKKKKEGRNAIITGSEQFES